MSPSGVVLSTCPPGHLSGARLNVVHSGQQVWQWQIGFNMHIAAGSLHVCTLHLSPTTVHGRVRPDQWQGECATWAVPLSEWGGVSQWKQQQSRRHKSRLGGAACISERWVCQEVRACLPPFMSCFGMQLRSRKPLAGDSAAALFACAASSLFQPAPFCLPRQCLPCRATGGDKCVQCAADGRCLKCATKWSVDSGECILLHFGILWPACGLCRRGPVSSEGRRSNSSTPGISLMLPSSTLPAWLPAPATGRCVPCETFVAPGECPTIRQTGQRPGRRCVMESSSCLCDRCSFACLQLAAAPAAPTA